MKAPLLMQRRLRVHESMVPWGRALLACVATVVVAHASVTVSWNVRTSPRPTPQTAVVTSVQGTHVMLRMRDGTLRAYDTTPAQAKLLRGLVGSAIRYRVQPR